MTITSYLPYCKLPPFTHQIIGIEKIVQLDDKESGRVIPGCFALFDEMGNGKSLQAIVAAQILMEQGLINKVLVICPAAVRTVWFDPELGELKKHLWDHMPVRITEFHQKQRQWYSGPKVEKPFKFVITNYDFIRSSPAREKTLRPYCDRYTLMILDESAAVKSHRSQQTRACLRLRQRCGRVLLLNGTPIANNPLDMFAQGRMMDPRIINLDTFTHFRAKYSILIPGATRIVGWQNLEDLTQRFAPYVLRRLKTDCLDLPEKMPPQIMSVALSQQTWNVYREMRDEMVAWLNQATAAVANQAPVKAMRLAQITSGFVGGIQEIEKDDVIAENAAAMTRPDWLPAMMQPSLPLAGEPTSPFMGFAGIPDHLRQEGKPLPPVEISREKLDYFLDWVEERLDEDPQFKLLVWCRFRPELARVHLNLQERVKNVELGLIHGGQKRADRQHAIRLLDPRTSPNRPVIVAGTPATGRMGLNLTAAHTVVYMSNDYSLFTRQQSEDRVHRPGQFHPVSYFDVVATGPAGQRTIDHIIIKALRDKKNLAEITTAGWRNALLQEDSVMLT